MKGTIITLDVSKGNCHYQGFIDIDTAFSKPKMLYFTKTSFKELDEYALLLKKKSRCKDIAYIFEATGVYHQVLKKYLDDNDYTYYVVSPLLSAKFRQTELHSNKTDSLDCRNIAKVFYGCKAEFLHLYKSPESKYNQLQKLNRYYEDVLKHIRKYKVTLRTYLDIALPGFDDCFSNKDVYTSIAMEILKKWPHPDLINKTSKEAMILYLVDHVNHNYEFIEKQVIKVKEWAKDAYSGCNKNDVIVKKIPLLVEHVRQCSIEANDLLAKIIQKASKVALFHQLCSIPGIGENLAARILIELGDIKRFKSLNKLTSYVGIDPMIRQSGKNDGIHLSISKKGNKNLRCLLYLAVEFNIRQKKNDPINSYYLKKRSGDNPLKPKAAKVAAMRKLLSIIYGMSKSGEMYKYNKEE